MKKLLLIPVLALILAGCAGQSAVTGGTGTVVTPPTIVSQVQAATATACKFLPTAETVLNIVGTFTDVSSLSAIASVADSICSAVTAKGARRGGARVRGVAVRGRFIQ